MHEQRPNTGDLPEAIEDAVLGILEGDDATREHALRRLLLAHPEHTGTIRHWLVSAGVAVPFTVGSGSASSGGHSDIDSDTDLPQPLGPYLLLEQLGRGGFGTVFRAEQQEPIRRPVAVKILNAGMDSRDVLARFAAEREALNRMDHPGIARLLDAGTTPKGRPFFVMELVAGPTLLAHCRKKRLPLRARIQLFLSVLDAMQHAHQKAMLHRDLSSNNVLVADPEGTPQPKVIDFGIAKSLDSPLLHGGAMTLRGTLMGTPEFMSPEQAAGNVEDLDTRSDVYALGVQIYELLSDQLPIPSVTLRSRGVAGIADVVQNHMPSRPSDAAPRERRSQLRGDLDGIVLKAIAKAREERYGSVGELAADLRRYLTDQPVQVVTPSTWYRLRKFVRRNRPQSIAIAIAAVGLCIAFVTMWSSVRMAHASAEESKRLQQVSAEKADAGFLLLANEERLAAAISAEQALPPPWPEHAAAYAQWLQMHGLPLERERDKLRQRLSSLMARGNADDDRPSDLAALHLANALQRLDVQLATFHSELGPLRRVQRRQQLLTTVIAPAKAQHAEAWQLAIASVQRSDGTSACRDYRGLRIPVMAGLVPLGAERATGLWHFLDLASHAVGYPLPTRDPATGSLLTGAGTGIVFTLLPSGRLEQGARRNRPGVDRNDELANDDELAGSSVALDAFLVACTELTQAQWSRLTGAMPLNEDPLLPATGIDWHEGRYVLTRFGMNLPTEAQWELACRARGRWPWSSGPDLAAVAECGWFKSGTQPVGLLAANAFGLFDLHGNVAEWCEDEKLSYADSTPRRGDGLRQRTIARQGDELRVVRGGAWHQGPEFARTTARDGKSPSSRDTTVGLRPVRRLR